MQFNTLVPIRICFICCLLTWHPTELVHNLHGYSLWHNPGLFDHPKYIGVHIHGVLGVYDKELNGIHTISLSSALHSGCIAVVLSPQHCLLEQLNGEQFGHPVCVHVFVCM